MPKKRGLGPVGLERIKQSLEEVNSPSENGPALPWLVGGPPSTKNQELAEQIRRENAEFVDSIGAKDVVTLPDLWPDRSNYYKGPQRSTRVSRHRFVMNRSATGTVLPTGLGTVFVKFTNMRPNGRVRRQDVYAYYDVPFTVYQAFSGSNSKGQFINHTLNQYLYANLNKDESVFAISFRD